MTPDDDAYPLLSFMNPLHVEVRLCEPLDAKASRMWFSALHAYAYSKHLRTEEVGGVIEVRGAGKAVRLGTGQIVQPGPSPVMGRRLLLWIVNHDAVERMRFWPRREGRGYTIVVHGGMHG